MAFSRRKELPISWVSAVLLFAAPLVWSAQSPTPDTCPSLLMTNEVPVVRVSRQCVGSCRVHMFIGMLESRILKERGTPVALSAGFITASVFAQNFVRALDDLDPTVGTADSDPGIKLVRKLLGSPDQRLVSQYWKQVMSSPARHSSDEDLGALIKTFGLIPASILKHPDSVEEQLSSSELRRKILADPKIWKKLITRIKAIRTAQSKVKPLTDDLSAEDKKELLRLVERMEEKTASSTKKSRAGEIEFLKQVIALRIPHFEHITLLVAALNEISRTKKSLEKFLTQTIFNGLGELNIENFSFDGQAYTPETFAQKILGDQSTELKVYPTAANLNSRTLYGRFLNPQFSEEAELHGLFADEALEEDELTPEESLKTYAEIEMNENPHFDLNDAMMSLTLKHSREPTAVQLAELRPSVERKIRAEIDIGRSVGASAIWLRTFQSGKLLSLPAENDDALWEKASLEATRGTSHAFQIVGYQLDAEGRVNLWKIQNSWGTDVGESGLFYMTRGYFERFVDSYSKIGMR